MSGSADVVAVAIRVERQYYHSRLQREIYDLPEHRVVYYYDESGAFEYSEFIRKEDSIYSSQICGAV